MRLREILYFASTAIPAATQHVQTQDSTPGALFSNPRSAAGMHRRDVGELEPYKTLLRRGACYGKACQKTKEKGRALAESMASDSVAGNSGGTMFGVAGLTAVPAEHVNFAELASSSGQQPSAKDERLPGSSPSVQNSDRRTQMSQQGQTQSGPGNPQSRKASSASQSILKQPGITLKPAGEVDFTALASDQSRSQKARASSSRALPAKSSHHKRSIVLSSSLLVRRGGGCFGRGCPTVKIPILRKTKSKAKENDQPPSPTSSTASGGTKMIKSLMSDDGPSTPRGSAQNSKNRDSSHAPRNSDIHSSFGTDLTLSLPSRAGSDFFVKQPAMQSAPQNAQHKTFNFGPPEPSGDTPQQRQRNQSPPSKAPSPHTPPRRNGIDYNPPPRRQNPGGASSKHDPNRVFTRPDPNSQLPKFTLARDDPMISGALSMGSGHSFLTTGGGSFFSRASSASSKLSDASSESGSRDGNRRQSSSTNRDSVSLPGARTRTSVSSYASTPSRVGARPWSDRSSSSFDRPASSSRRDSGTYSGSLPSIGMSDQGSLVRATDALDRESLMGSNL